MQMKTKSFVLLLWIQTLTFVKCQDCLLEKFLTSRDYDPNFDTSALESQYPNRKQVRVPCVAGYAGFFKLTCVDGNWKPVGSKCQAKSCGHPGDAQFADFQLVDGDDFVFGSKVAYTCHRGFQMVSRTNFRRCMADGWDGVVPVCEAQRCSVIHARDKVQVIGDPEEATFGNVVRFSCKSNSEILIGATEIYCNENGQWSGEAPECKEIKCDVPVIEHGHVIGSPREYRENEVLNFACEDGYKKTDERSPRCIKVRERADWSPTPGCRLKTCDLDLQAGTGVRYVPSNQNVFLPGATLQVICGKGYWIEDPHTTTTEITCKNSGEWSMRPVCKVVTCSNPRDNTVYDWRAPWWGTQKLDDTVYYTCRSGYEKPEGVTKATCTRDGWTPKPLCKTTWCTKPDIENAVITYDHRSVYGNGDYFQYRCADGDQTHTARCERGTWSGIVICSDKRHCVKPFIRNGFSIGPIEDNLYYSCNEGFKLSTKAWWGVAKCSQNGQWSPMTACIANSSCGDAPKILKGKARLEQGGGPKRLRIVCDKGYRAQITHLTCVDGIWDSSVPLAEICQSTGDHCRPPIKVDNALITTAYQTEYLSDSTVTYQCRDRYIMEGEGTVTCRDGEWEKTTISCQAYCDSLQDEKLTVTLHKERYKNGEVIEYVCKAPDANDEGTATCVDGKWNVTVECQGIPCDVGETHIHLRVTGLPPSSDKVKSGEKLEFSCQEPFVLQGSKEVECLETGKWNTSFPICSANSSCGKPPPLEDGDIKGSSKSQYGNHESVEYMCQRYYVMEGEERRTCVNGEWTGEIKCLKPCTVTHGAMAAHNIRLAYKRDNKMYAEHGDYISFACTTGRRVGEVDLRQRCVNGEMPLPTCQ